jgi:transcriptional regulator with XRE-family HTH domain
MQARAAPIRLVHGSDPYNSGVPRKPPSVRSRPKQGAHLLALRKAAGLTQTELAAFVGVPQPNIAFWEWSDKPPRSDVLPKMAKAFGVRIDEIIVDQESKALAKRPGPIGEVQRAFEEVRRLPRKQQRKVVEIVSAMLEQYRRKAS